MEGVSLIETTAINRLIEKVETLQEIVLKTAAELADAKKPYLTAQEVTRLTGFSLDWITDHKQDIGYTNVGRTIRFKRKDVEAFMEANYFKTKSSRRANK